MWSGVTPGNPIPGHDLRHEKVTLFQLTATSTCNSQGKRAVSRTKGGVYPLPRRPCAMRSQNVAGGLRGCGAAGGGRKSPIAFRELPF
jgi:hypothetical protein